MLLPDVMTLARSLMEANDVGGWNLKLDHARRRAGQTNHTSRTISLSRHLMALYDEEQVRETVLHEIAHARVGAKHGHDAVWRAEAIRLGASGKRLVDLSAPTVPAPWVGVCPNGHRVERMRRPSRPMSCAQCARKFDERYLITWRRA